MARARTPPRPRAAPRRSAGRTASASRRWSRSARTTARPRLARETRKGANGVGTDGVTANFMVFDRGTFRVLPLTCFYLPKSARAYLFPQSVKIHSFCSRPISVDPICPPCEHSPSEGGGRARRRRADFSSVFLIDACLRHSCGIICAVTSWPSAKHICHPFVHARSVLDRCGRFPH